MTEPNLFNPEGEDEPRHEGELRRLSAHEIVEIKQMCEMTLTALVRLEKTMGKLLDLANGINTTTTMAVSSMLAVSLRRMGTSLNVIDRLRHRRSPRRAEASS